MTLRDRRPTDKERQLLLWLRINKGRTTYFSSLHSKVVKANCRKRGWLTESHQPYEIRLTDAGNTALGPER